MSYNGSGTFQINTSGQPVVAGTVISSTAFNALTADLATGLSTAITKDGQTTTTARIPFAAGINSSLTTDSSSTSTGSIITAGGAGIAKALYVGTTANVAGAVTLQSTLGVTGVATFSAAPIYSSLTASSAVATDASKALVSVTNTGTGNNVLATSPTLVTPILGAASATSITFDAGAVGTPSITTTGDTNTGIFFPAADTIAFAEGGAEAMRIDSSGNVGIGTSSPLSSSGLTVSKNSLSVTTSDGNFGAGGKRTFMDMDSTNNVGRIGALSGGVASGTALALYYGAVTTGTTNEGMRIDSSGNLQFNSGYGSVATAYACRAWVAFNGTGTIAIRASGNISSLGDFGTGDYSVGFATNMPDTNYCAVGASIKGGGGPSGSNSGIVIMSEAPAVSAAGVGVITADGTAVDRAYVYAAFFR